MAKKSDNMMPLLFKRATAGVVLSAGIAFSMLAALVPMLTLVGVMNTPLAAITPTMIAGLGILGTFTAASALAAYSSIKATTRSDESWNINPTLQSIAVGAGLVAGVCVLWPLIPSLLAIVPTGATLATHGFATSAAMAAAPGLGFYAADRFILRKFYTPKP